MEGIRSQSDKITLMEEHLDSITQIIQEYESGAYLTADSLRDHLRTLTAQMYYLTAYKIDYKNQHNKIEWNFEGSGVKGKAWAHEQCPELYQCRYILKAAQNVVQSIIMEISILNKES